MGYAEKFAVNDMKTDQRQSDTIRANHPIIPKLGPKPEWFGHLGGILLQNQSPCSRIPKAAIQKSHPNTLIRMK